MPDAKLFLERAGEPSADQVFEFLPPEHYFHPFPANHFADAGMDDGDELAVERAPNVLDAFARNHARLLKQPNEIGAFRRQRKSDRDHSPVAVTEWGRKANRRSAPGGSCACPRR